MKTEEFNKKYSDYLDGKGLTIICPPLVLFLDKVFDRLIHIPGFRYHEIALHFDQCKFKTNLPSILGQFDYITPNIERKIRTIYDIYQEIKDYSQQEKEQHEQLRSELPKSSVQDNRERFFEDQ